MTTSEKCKLKGSYWIKPADEAYKLKILTPDLKENLFVYYRLVLHLNDPASLEL